jgi:hypothetical protein
MTDYYYTPQNDPSQNQGQYQAPGTGDIVPRPPQPHIIESASATTGDTSSNGAIYIVAALVCALVAWLLAWSISSVVYSDEYRQAFEDEWEQTYGSSGSSSDSGSDFGELSTLLPYEPSQA